MNRIIGIITFIAVLCLFVSTVRAAPAARVGDPTSHGGVIPAPGAPRVLINNMPAARAGDIALSPLVVFLVPCIGGPILTGSLTVIIGGLPAARQGDSAATACGPQTIVRGSPTVLIGN